MIKSLHASALFATCYLAGCANTPANQTDLTAAYNVAAAVESAYAASPNADPAQVKQGAALLAAAQAALLTWQNAPSGSTTESAALSAAIAALIGFEAELDQTKIIAHAVRNCDPSDPICFDGVHRG